MSKNTVLIVDDDEVIRNTLQRYFEGLGYYVDLCENGRDGYNRYLALKGEIFVLVTDIFMPVQDGIELITSIRKDDEDTKIIAVSAGSLGHRGDDAISFLETAEVLGANYIIQKPLKSSQLNLIVSAISKSYDNKSDR
jgi:CheY-like chemotaxis protein